MAAGACAGGLVLLGGRRAVPAALAALVLGASPRGGDLASAAAGASGLPDLGGQAPASRVTDDADAACSARGHLLG